MRRNEKSMLETTLAIIKSGLKGDPSISPRERAALLARLRNGLNDTKPEPLPEPAARLIRRREAAARLSCSLRLVDRLAATGVLRRRKLPGRTRASGFLESDVASLVVGRAHENSEVA